MKTLAKSLHTVTVLVRVARHIQDEIVTDAAGAVDRALDLLGYAGAPDPYNLVGAALKQLETPRA